MLSQKQLKKLIDSWLIGEVKVIEEACSLHMKRIEGKASEEFKAFATVVFIEAVHRGLRNPY